MKKVLRMLLVLGVVLSIFSSACVLAGDYFRFTLHLYEHPQAGQKPQQLTCDSGNDYITFQEWSGKFDENGCGTGLYPDR